MTPGGAGTAGTLRPKPDCRKPLKPLSTAGGSLEAALGADPHDPRSSGVRGEKRKVAPRRLPDQSERDRHGGPRVGEERHANGAPGAPGRVFRDRPEHV